MSNASDWEMRAMDAEQRLADVFDFIRREGYRECNIPACNCGSWHGGHAGDRLREISDIVPHNGVVLKDAIEAIIEERDRLRSLAAVRAPGDEEVADVVQELERDRDYLSITDRANWAAQMERTVRVIRRLTASLSSAERERDVARAAVEGGALVPISEWNVTIAERDELKDALAVALVERDRAREAALEEAAKVVEAIADDRFREHGSTEPDTNASYYQCSQAEFYEAQDEENETCASAIRALKQKEPQA